MTVKEILNIINNLDDHSVFTQTLTPNDINYDNTSPSLQENLMRLVLKLNIRLNCKQNMTIEDFTIANGSGISFDGSKVRIEISDDGDIGWTDDDYAVLFDVINNDPRITTLKIHDHYMNNQTFRLLTHMMTFNTNIKKLSIKGIIYDYKHHGHPFDNSLLDNVITMLHKNKTLTSFSFSFEFSMKFSPTAINDFYKKLNFTNSVLTHLDLSDNNINNEQALYIAYALEHNTSIVDINLSFNDINGPEALSGLVRVLNKTNIIFVNLDHNRIDDHGIRILMDGLKSNKHVKRISLWQCNKYTDQALQYIINMLCHNTIIEDINMGEMNTTFNEILVENIRLLLSRNSQS